ncbi:LPXTG cell wall anchor domain-containing protein [Carnobacterium maltaromaticum]|uniref:LPXTG cell wall anchor domain-containing protein n=1 Tax=Carnobacterium maltaromaticum TaxID=2751 RepID=A0AAW9K853_CARML|nr:LPXTG cell wall anchor domain-containing protein [Carnobacterium maltaromaticum]MDZ5759957.1 LPXTG cell wall anchor domain-containing protein [Carnobacterium maltaromaticum]
MKRNDILKTLAVCSVTLSMLTTEIGSTALAVEPIVNTEDTTEKNEKVKISEENSIAEEETVIEEDQVVEENTTEEFTEPVQVKQQESAVISNLAETIIPPISRAGETDWEIEMDGFYVGFDGDEEAFTFDLLTNIAVKYIGSRVVTGQVMFNIEDENGQIVVPDTNYEPGTVVKFADYGLTTGEYYVRFIFPTGKNSISAGAYINMQKLEVQSIVDKPINPESILNTSNSDTSNETWVIRHTDGREWTGSGNPTKDFLESLPNGDYTNTVSSTSQTKYGNPLADETTNTFSIRRPDPVVAVEKPFNPKEITAGLELPNSTGSWEIFDESGTVVASGTDITTIPVPTLEGKYTVKVRETSVEGLFKDAETNFEIRYPKATVTVDKPFNPEKITATNKIPDSTVTWEIKDENGKVINSGTGLDIPVPVEEGKYTVTVTETSPEGEISIAKTNFQIRHPEATVTVDKPFNPEKITATNKIPDSTVTWEMKDETGKVINSGTGLDIPVPDEEGKYTVAVTETSPEGETSIAVAKFEIRHPEATVAVDKHFNPEKITATNKIPDSTVTWEIKDENGKVVNSGTGLDIPVPTEEGKYKVIVVETSPEGERSNAETNFEIRHPEATVTVDKSFNPEKITATNKISDSTVTWEMKDETGTVISSGTGLDIPVPDEEGKYQVAVTEISPEGESSIANVDFEIRHPKAEVIVDKAINPEKITGTHKIPDSEVYWVITDEDGKAIASGVGTEIPVPEDEGKYQVTLVEKSPEGEISSDRKKFEVRHPEATVAVDQPFNPEKITATNKISDSTVIWEIVDENGVVISNGTGLDIPVPIEEGKYKVLVTETSPENEISVAETSFEIRHPQAEVEVDKAVNPEKITGSQKILDSTLTWEITDQDGTVISSGTGSDIPVPTDNGHYTVTVTETSPENETSVSSSDFEIRHPKATAEVDKPVNPGKLTAGQKLPDSTLTWEVRDLAGNLISTGSGTDAEVPKLEGHYQLITTETSLEGEAHTASVNFEVRYPKAEVEVSKPINPETITGGQKIPDSELTWEITDESGTVISSGSGKDIPVPTENGTYTVKITETSPEGEISIVNDTFVVRHPDATIEIEKPLNPDKITAGQKLPDSTLTWVIKDKDGNIISTGTGPDIPVPTEDGSYTVTVTETSTEGEISITTDTFEIKKNPVIPPVTPEKPGNNQLPNTGGPTTTLTKEPNPTKVIKEKLPQTSETANQSLMMGSLLSLAGIAFLLNKRNKDRQKE